jgi:hypothetical protein
MKNQILLSLSIIFLFFSCQNATNKIKDTSSKNDTNTVESPNNNTITDNSINAQIIDHLEVPTLNSLIQVKLFGTLAQ